MTANTHREILIRLVEKNERRSRVDQVKKFFYGQQRKDWDSIIGSVLKENVN